MSSQTILWRCRFFAWCSGAALPTRICPSATLRGIPELRALMALMRRSFQLVVERCTPRLERARCAKTHALCSIETQRCRQWRDDSRASKHPAPQGSLWCPQQRMHMNGALRSGTTSTSVLEAYSRCCFREGETLLTTMGAW